MESEIRYYASILKSIPPTSAEIPMYNAICKNLFDRRNQLVLIIQTVEDILLSIDKSKIILDTSALCADTIKITSGLKVYLYN